MHLRQQRPKMALRFSLAIQTRTHRSIVSYRIVHRVVVLTYHSRTYCHSSTRCDHCMVVRSLVIRTRPIDDRIRIALIIQVGTVTEVGGNLVENFYQYHL